MLAELVGYEDDEARSQRALARGQFTEYGGEYEECFVENENCNDDILFDVNMCKLEFIDIFEKIGGKVITNLNDYIRYKYNNY